MNWSNFFLNVTRLGNWPSVVWVVTLVSLFFFWRKKGQLLVPFFLTVGGTALSSLILKNIFQRPRPSSSLVLEKTFSLPSSHAAVALALYGFLVFIILRSVRSNLWRLIIFTLGLVIIFLIGYSRLYFRIHYLSDVLAGYALGFIWLIVGVLIAKRAKI